MQLNFLILLVFSTSCFAFQLDCKLLSDKSNQNLLLDSAQLLVFEGKNSEAEFLIVTIQKCLNESGQIDKKLELYESLFAAIIQNTELDFESKKQRIDVYLKKENDLAFKGIYFAAQAYLNAVYQKKDAAKANYNFALEHLNKSQRFRDLFILELYLIHENYSQEQIVQAKYHLDKAIELLKQNRPAIKKEDLIVFYNLASVVETELGDYEASNRFSLDFLALNIDLIEPVELAVTYQNIANNYSYLKDAENAELYYSKALLIVHQSAEVVFDIRLNQGIGYSDSGNEEMALKILSELEESLMSKDNELNVVNRILLFQCLQDVHFKLKNNELAKKYLDRLLTLNKTNAYRIEITYNSFAEFYYQQKNYTQALFYLNKAEKIVLDKYGPINFYLTILYNLKAKIYIELSDFKKSLFYNQKALQSISLDFKSLSDASNPEISAVINKEYYIFALKSKLQTMKKLYEQNSKLINADDILSTCRSYVRAFVLQNRSLKDEGSKLALMNQQVNAVFEQVIELSLHLYEKEANAQYLESAFEFMEQGRAMLMSDALHENMATTGSAVPQKLIGQEKQCRKLINYLKKKIYDAKVEGDLSVLGALEQELFEQKNLLNKLILQFEQDYPKYHKLKYAENRLNLKQIQASLDAQSVILEYFEGQENIYLFTLSHKGLAYHKIIKHDAFDRDIHQLVQAFSDMNLLLNDAEYSWNTVTSLGYLFYKKYVEIAQLKDFSQWIIIPDGQFSFLPFEALITKEFIADPQKKPSERYHKLPYLLFDKTISYHYSASAVLESKNTPSIGNGLVLGMAPEYNNYLLKAQNNQEKKVEERYLQALPGAMKELTFLEKYFQGLFLRNQYAHEAAFKKEAPQYSVIHLAMHGLMDQQHPAYSNLAMSKNNDTLEDNLLHAYEIKNLNLNADMIVLSACETGIGKFQKGEGLLSIGRSFMYAGASSMVMTLWQLNDYSGAEIISLFYKYLAQGMNNDSALQKAKIEYIKDKNDLLIHPALWACYVQFGKTDSIKLQQKNGWLIWLSVLSACIGLFLIFMLNKRKLKSQP